MLATDALTRHDPPLHPQTQPLVGIVILHWKRPADTIAAVAVLR